MMTQTRSNATGLGRSLASPHLDSGLSDRASVPLASSAGPHTAFRDRAEFSTVQEEIANLKDILSKYISGRRGRRNHNRR